MRSQNPVIRWVGALLTALSLAIFPLRACAQTNTSGDANSAAVDPMAWKQPAELPSLHARMNPDAYDGALQNALRHIDMDAVKQPDEPLGQLPTPIDPDTPWNPQTAYWNSPQRDPRWDDQMLVACTNFDTNPPLADTALWDAQKAGYAGWLLPALESRIAWNQWRFDDALNFGSFALADAPDDRKPVIARWMFGAAKADFKLNEALQLATKYPLAEQEDVRRLRQALRLYRALALPPRPDPLVALKNLLETDLTKSLVAVHVKGSVNSPWQTNGFVKSGRLGLQAPGGHYQLFAFGPKAANVDFTAHFKFHESDKKDTDWQPSLKFAIVDPADNGTEQCEVDLFTTGLVDLEASGPSVGLTEWPPSHWQTDGTIRIIVLGPDVEVFIDGKRAYYCALRDPAATRQLCFEVQAVGVHAEVSRVSWKKIETK
jgi:hypothetical protein